MALNAVGIATAIAALDVSGVNIRDLDDIPVAVADRDCPIMFPRPDGWLGGYSSTVDTFGVTDGMRTCHRVLLYTYLHCKVGEGRPITFEQHRSMTINADLLYETLFELNVSGVDVEDVVFGEFGPVPDPSGNVFHGFTISLAVSEFINA